MSFDSKTEEILTKTTDVVFRVWAVPAYSRIYQGGSECHGELVLDYLDPATLRMARETHIRAGWNGTSPLRASLSRDKVVHLWEGSDAVAYLVSMAEKLARGRTFTAALPVEAILGGQSRLNSTAQSSKEYEVSEGVKAEREAFVRFIDDALTQKRLPPKQAEALQKRQRGDKIGSAAGRVALMAAKKKLKELHDYEDRFHLLFGSWVDRSDAENRPKAEAEPAAIYQIAAGNEMTAGAVATPSQREQIRHMDVWGTGIAPSSPAARAVWDEAIAAFKTGDNSQKVLDMLHTVAHLEPTFLMAKVQASAVHFRDGKLKQAVVELEEIAHHAEGEFEALVKSNLSDYYVTLWERSHRQTRSHLNKAVENAQESMAYPTPARVVNQIIALTKTGEYEKAEAELLHALHSNHPDAPAHKIVATLHRVQDKDLKKLYIVMTKSKEG